MVKFLLNKLVRAKGEAILMSYEAVKRHMHADHHINRWTRIILDKMAAEKSETTKPRSDCKEISGGDKDYDYHGF